VSDNQPSDYEQNPQEQHARWVREFSAARKQIEPWQKKGDEIDQEFRNEVSDSGAEHRLPLFTSDVQTMVSMLFGQIPRATASRRFGDADDDLGRVAGVILERFINSDVTKDGDTYVDSLRNGLMDFFLPGFCLQLNRYDTGALVTESHEAETDQEGNVLVEAYETTLRPKENVAVDYKHWKDWLWGPSSVVQDIPWWAHRAKMSRKELEKRFGAKGKLVPLKKNTDGTEDPWSRAEVWEIWEKETRRVYWFCEAHTELLDDKEDPLGLDGFYPFPKPLVANLTTSKVVPRPFYALHRDQYQQVNLLMTRVHDLVEGIRISGVCDKASWEVVHAMLEPHGRGKIMAIEGWMKFSEQGGIKGVVDWFPLEQIVQALTVTMGQLASEIDLLHQTTGFADIMRGEATQAGATATEQRVKARTGSVRVQRLQDQIAEYATDLLKIRAEIGIKQFTAETIKERANVRFMPQEDQAMADAAIELLKSDFACYRIEVKPENVALADFAAMKAERLEFLETLTLYFTNVAPLVSHMPDALEDLLEIGKWAAAGIRGSSGIEGVFDRMVAKAKAASERRKNNPQPPPPDPKVVAEQMKQQTAMQKGQLDMQKETLKHQQSLERIGVEVQADAMREENQRQSNVQEFAQRQMVSNTLKPPTPPKGLPR
jgi:hypothetical protein